MQEAAPNRSGQGGSQDRSRSRGGWEGRGGGDGRRCEDQEVCFLKDTKQYGRGSGRVGGGSGGVGGSGMMGARGMEPAVKGGGLISTMTFLKLVSRLVSFYSSHLISSPHFISCLGAYSMGYSNSDACPPFTTLSSILLPTHVP